MTLSERAVRHPVTTVMVFVTMAVLGGISLSRIGMELFPDVSYPTAAIVTLDPGVGPFDVEDTVTRPIEDAVSTINGVDKVKSTSAEGVSLVIVSFTWSTDMSSIVGDIREKITGIEDDLPDEAERPQIFRFNPEVLPALTFTISSPVEELDLRRLAEDRIVPELERLAGVASCELLGGRKAAVTVKLDLDAIGMKRIPIPQILQAFGGANVNLPGGSVSLEDRYLVLRTLGEFETLEDIEGVLVGYREGVPVYLGDVAVVSLASLPQEEYVHAAGRKGVQIEVNKMQGHNTVEVIDAAKKALHDLEASLPPSVRIDISSDQSVSIKESIGGVTDAAWQGGLLAVAVLLFFLRNLRSTLIVSLAIPVSVVATFTLMDVVGIDLNIMSLAGLTLGVGMFVDNSIVVLEVIYRKLLAGMSSREAAIAGASEVSRAVMASTLTNVVVFLPIVFITGFANIIMRDLAWTLSFSMIVSLLMALTLVPVLCSRLLKVQKGATLRPRKVGQIDLELSLADVELHTGHRLIDAVANAIRGLIQALDDFYERALQWSVRHAGWVIGVAVVLLGLSVLSVWALGLEFLPETDEGRLAISLETRVQSPYPATERKVAEVERVIMDVLGKDLATLSSVTGQGGGIGALGQTGSHYGRINLTLVNKDSRRRSIWTIVSELQSAIRSRVTDLKFAISISGLSSLVSLAAGSESPVVVELAGDDLVASSAFAERVANMMRSVSGARDVEVSYEAGKPELQFRILRRQAVSLGLSPLEIAATIRAAYKGIAVSSYRDRERDETYDVYVMLRDEDRNSLDRVSELFLVNPAGARIPLENVVEMTQGTGPVAIERADKTRIIKVVCALTGERALNRVVDDVRVGLAALGRPPAGVRVTVTGSSTQMTDAFSSLFLALLLGMALVYFVMASQFESLVHPFIVLFSIPFGLIGLTLALLVTNTTFSLVAFIGAILLVGYVVNSAIILVDYMNVLRGSGMSLEKAIHVGGRTRLKPILMSVGTTALGLLPMALGLGTGAELRAPMARAVFGGLTSSTLITLILIPVIYQLVERRRERRSGP